MSRTPAQHVLRTTLAAAALGVLSCDQHETKTTRESTPPPREGIVQVGSLVIGEEDVQHRLEEDRRGDDRARQATLEELVKQARLAQAALDAGLAEDPVVRAEVGRILASRYRELELTPKVLAGDEIPPARLRELYDRHLENYQALEQRQVAVLWLNPGKDPERARRSAAKLAEARAFALESPDIFNHPERGFSILGADYSEHSASRFRGGIVGWMKKDSGSDPWTRAVSQISFELGKTGEISEVISRPEGVFLVRLIKVKPGVTRPFEAVAAELERNERARARQERESELMSALEERYPARWTQPPGTEPGPAAPED